MLSACFQLGFAIFEHNHPYVFFQVNTGAQLRQTDTATMLTAREIMDSVVSATTLFAAAVAV